MNLILRPLMPFSLASSKRMRMPSVEPIPQALTGPLKAMIASPFIHQEMGFFVAQLNKDDLKALGDLMESGKVTPVIDRRYPLSQVPDAIRYLEEGHARGKVVITME